MEAIEIDKRLLSIFYYYNGILIELKNTVSKLNELFPFSNRTYILLSQRILDEALKNVQKIVDDENEKRNYLFVHSLYGENIIEIKTIYNNFHIFAYKIYNILSQLHSISALPQPDIELVEEEYKNNLYAFTSSVNSFADDGKINSIINYLKEEIQNVKIETRKIRRKTLIVWAKAFLIVAILIALICSTQSETRNNFVSELLDFIVLFIVCSIYPILFICGLFEKEYGNNPKLGKILIFSFSLLATLTLSFSVYYTQNVYETRKKYEYLRSDYKEALENIIELSNEQDGECNNIYHSTDTLIEAFPNHWDYSD